MAGPTQIEASLKEGLKAAPVSIYTLTSGTREALAPKQWTLKGSDDGTTSTTLDERKAEKFLWPRQTRAFALKVPATFAKYRLELGDGAVIVAEFELLGTQPKAAPSP